MIDTSAARKAILARIRSRGIEATAVSTGADYDRIPRAYKREGKLDPEQRLDLFEDRLHEYDAVVHRVQAASLPSAIADALTVRHKHHMAVGTGLSANWQPEGFLFTQADHLTGQELDRVDGFLSSCTVAIALTGTIVLQSAPGQGPRKLSLVPDYHLCVVFADQIVETVSEAFDRLAATATLPTTFISGPSATADIEMTRIKGVHGPRFLDVLIAT